MFFCRENIEEAPNISVALYCVARFDFIHPTAQRTHSVIETIRTPTPVVPLLCDSTSHKIRRAALPDWGRASRMYRLMVANTRQLNVQANGRKCSHHPSPGRFVFSAVVYKVLDCFCWCLGHIPSLVPLPIRTAKSSLGEHG